MKRKNLIFGLIAIVFAVGSTFASEIISEINSAFIIPTYVRVKKTPTDQFHCEEVKPQCDGSGPFDCHVKIAVTKPGVMFRIVFGRDRPCAVVKHQTSAVFEVALVDGTIPYDAE